MWILGLEGLNGKTINVISSTDLAVMVTNNLFMTWSSSKTPHTLKKSAWHAKFLALC